jgi:hypothetical protein
LVGWAMVSGCGGLIKLLRPKDRLIRAGMRWVEDFSPDCIKLIGLAETFAAVGLTLPGLTGVVPVLVPLAAVGLMAVMIGAVMVPRAPKRNDDDHRERHSRPLARI